MRRWFEPVDAASLVAFRIAFGILMFVEVVGRLESLRRNTTFLDSLLSCGSVGLSF